MNLTNIREYKPSLADNLSGWAKRQRFASSYLLVGNDYKIKLSVVQYMTKVLNCQQEDFYPCGSCPACLMIDDFKYYGLWVINDEHDKKTSTIKIETIRELRKQVMHGSENNWVVIFIKNTQTMTVDASNVLLKILEDTPKQIMFIFDVPTKYSVLPTIRSRSHAIYMGEYNKQEHVDIFPGVSVENFSSYIMDTPLKDLFKLFESLKLDRKMLRNALECLKQFFLNSLKDSGCSECIVSLSLVDQYIKYLERPINVQNLLFTFTIKFKEL